LLKNLFLLNAPAKDKLAVTEVFNRLIERYKEPSRHYHTLEHILNGFKVYYQLFALTEQLPVLEFFAWMYHDAVYDTTQSDNEAKSAEVFMRDAPMLGFTMEDVDKVTQLILATEPSAEPLSVINDMDLAELGADPAVFDANTDNIRKEYYWVEPKVWRKGRIAVLSQILKRENLYVTKPFSDKFSNQAVENLKRAITNLKET
jgi:predicted metal-dependent HD superfamily phosphohydrolase